MDAKRIGGSSIAAIIGMDPFKTSFDVWRSCLGHKDETSIPKRFGIHAEPFVRELFREWHLEQYGLETGLVGPTAYEYEEWCACHLDDLTATHVVELKTVSIRNAWKWSGPEAPINYQLQCQLYMHVSGVKRAYLFGLIGNESIRCYEIEAEPSVQEMLVRCGAQFWRQYIATGCVPPFDGGEGAKAWLKEKYPYTSSVIREATADDERWAREYVEAKKRLDEAETRFETVKQNIQNSIGTQEGVRTNYGIFTYRANKNGHRILKLNRT